MKNQIVVMATEPLFRNRILSQKFKDKCNILNINDGITLIQLIKETKNGC